MNSTQPNPLLFNAIKYNKKDGKIKVSIIKENDRVVFSVVDTGYGISSKDLPFIFDKFYRVDNARKNDGSMGLGLSLVKEYVEKNNGIIEVNSKKGRGSCFKIIFFDSPFKLKNVKPTTTTINIITYKFYTSI